MTYDDLRARVQFMKSRNAGSVTMNSGRLAIAKSIAVALLTFFSNTVSDMRVLPLMTMGSLLLCRLGDITILSLEFITVEIDAVDADDGDGDIDDDVNDGGAVICPDCIQASYCNHSSLCLCSRCDLHDHADTCLGSTVLQVISHELILHLTTSFSSLIPLVITIATSLLK